MKQVHRHKRNKPTQQLYHLDSRGHSPSWEVLNLFLFLVNSDTKCSNNSVMLTYAMGNKGEKKHTLYIRSWASYQYFLCLWRSYNGLKHIKYAYYSQCSFKERRKRAVTIFTFSLSLCIKYDTSKVTVNLSKPTGQNTGWQI